MSKERTAKTIFEELIQKADIERFFVESRSGRYSFSPNNHQGLADECAKQVGQLVMSLPEEDRELLANMTSEEIEKFGWIVNGYFRPRPEKPITRVRGPVTLSK